MDSTECKVVVLGLSPCGRSSLLVRLVRDEFSEVPDPTIQDYYNFKVRVDGTFYNLIILDTSSEEGYESYQKEGLSWADGFILAYATDSRSSYEAARPYRAKIFDTKKEKVPLLLIATKADLGPSERQVSEEEGRKLAEEFACPFFETSAKKGSYIKEPFITVIRLITQARNSKN